VPVPVEPEYETFRYVQGPRRHAPPAPAPSPPRRMIEDEHTRIHVSDREYYRR
jgi:hypothetical protein